MSPSCLRLSRLPLQWPVFRLRYSSRSGDLQVAILLLIFSPLLSTFCLLVSSFSLPFPNSHQAGRIGGVMRWPFGFWNRIGRSSQSPALSSNLNVRLHRSPRATQFKSLPRSGPLGVGALALTLTCPPHRHSERSRPISSLAFAPAKASACAVEESLFSCL